MHLLVSSKTSSVLKTSMKYDTQLATQRTSIRPSLSKLLTKINPDGLRNRISGTANCLLRSTKSSPLNQRRKRAPSRAIRLAMKKRSNRADSSHPRSRSTPSRRRLKKERLSVPNKNTSRPVHSYSDRGSPSPQFLSSSSILRRLLAWLKRIRSKTTSRSIGSSPNNRLVRSSDSDSTSLSYTGSTDSPFPVFRNPFTPSTAYSTFSVTPRTNSARFSSICRTVRRRRPPLCSEVPSGLGCRSSWRRSRSSSQAYLAKAGCWWRARRARGWREEGRESRRLWSTCCLALAWVQGWRMAAKGESLPLPTFLKSQRTTFLGSLLTMEIISCTSCGVWCCPMHLRKKEISSAVRQPSALMSMASKASRMSSSEKSQRLMSYPVVPVWQLFLLVFLGSRSRRGSSCDRSRSDSPPGVFTLILYSLSWLLHIEASQGSASMAEMPSTEGKLSYALRDIGKQMGGVGWSGSSGKNVANRIRTCAGDPSRFLVCRLNHSAIATWLLIRSGS